MARNDPSVAICMDTIAVRPAAGPATLVCEPLSRPKANDTTTVSSAKAMVVFQPPAAFL